jgi:tetratricopeptide (TPR) repeat protein
MRGCLNLGALHIYSQRPNEALVYLKKALALAELTGDETSRGRIYINMGLAHIIGGNLTQAESYVLQAQTLLQKYTNTAELARAWDSLAAIYVRQGKPAEAIALSENALTVWRQLKNTEDEITTLMDLVEYELAGGNRQQAVLRLREVEHRIGPHKDTPYRHHLPRLVAMRRSLTEHIPQQAATDELTDN